MKLRKLFMPVFAVCLAFGICALSVGCGDDPKPTPPDGGKPTPPPDDSGTDNTTYYVTIEENGATLTSDLKVLFYSSTNSKLSTITDKVASADLPDGNYVAYITGTLDGYIYTPIALSADKTAGTIKLEKATPNENGQVPYQVLYLLEEDKIFEGDPENESGQICTVSSLLACYDIYFDDFHVATYNSRGEQFYLTKDENDIHEPHYMDEKPAGYTFDGEKYHTPANGGFCSVLYDKE